MKRKSYLYDQLYKYENIKNVFNEVCANTRNKQKVNRYRDYRCMNTYKVYNALINRAYEPGPVYRFVIYEPKKRDIVSQTMFDKLINHLVSRFILLPAIEPCLIETNVASRTGKGTSTGLKYYYHYRKVCKQKYKRYYILKCDVKKFFYSIDHEILKEKLKRRIKDKDALSIVFKIIDSEENGLSIGNMTSQILAIFYLNDFDHFVKEVLKVKYYVRYQDDFILFHSSKAKLKEYLEEIKKYLKKEKLELNKKTRIYKDKDNFIYLGRDVNGKYAKYRSVIRKNKKNHYLYVNNKIDLYSYISSIRNFAVLRKNVAKKFTW